MIEIRVEPITAWPGEQTANPTWSPFSQDTTYSSTKRVLFRELGMLDASDVVMGMYVKPSDVRRDGAMREDRRPSAPGVILRFRSPKARGGQLRFACDSYNNWKHNVRAIALAMGSLRRVDRYGVSGEGQQYAGFAALESAESARGFESREQAARFIVSSTFDPEQLTADDEERIVRLAEALLLDDELAAVYFRRAAAKAHPDRGGTDEWMARLAAARAMVEG